MLWFLVTTSQPINMPKCDYWKGSRSRIVMKEMPLISTCTVQRKRGTSRYAEELILFLWYQDFACKHNALRSHESKPDCFQNMWNVLGPSLPAQDRAVDAVAKLRLVAENWHYDSLASGVSSSFPPLFFLSFSTHISCVTSASPTLWSRTKITVQGSPICIL